MLVTVTDKRSVEIGYLTRIDYFYIIIRICLSAQIELQDDCVDTDQCRPQPSYRMCNIVVGGRNIVRNVSLKEVW